MRSKLLFYLPTKLQKIHENTKQFGSCFPKWITIFIDNMKLFPFLGNILRNILGISHIFITFALVFLCITQHRN